MTDLKDKKCVPCEGGVAPLTKEAAEKLLSQLNGWQLSADAKQINKEYKFKNFYETMAFVNATAWIANQENHHPDLKVSYNRCDVAFSTHAIKGLSENDFICGAKINFLLGTK